VRRREFITLLGGAAVAWPIATRAQQPMPVIGFLSSLAPSDLTHVMPAFQQGLDRAGFVEGRNVAIEYRWAEGDYHRLPALAADLVSRKVAVIAAISGTPAALAAKAATTTIPIVFAIGGDPIAPGLVSSLSRPGGNLTGVVLFEPTVAGKWLAMLKEIAPRLARAALVFNPKTAPYYDYYLRAGEAAASSLAVEFVPLTIENAAADIERAIEAFARVPNGGLVALPDSTNDVHRDLLIGLAAKHRLPAVYSNRFYVAAGGLMCYSTDRVAQFRQVAAYIDRILRGAKPADLPVQMPTKYETVVNMRTVKALGLTVPAGLLVAADEVIE
jgi:putative ABC transport system substrate-binding protein